MKLIILAAGPSDTANSSIDPPPKCLRRFDESSTVLDRIVESGRTAGCTEVVIVGGYQILAIMQAYPSYKYYYNPEWQRSDSLFSLAQAFPECTGSFLVAYSDVVFDPDRTRAFVTAPGQLVVATDSRWTTRYEGRTERTLEEAEKLYATETGTLCVSRKRLERGRNAGSSDCICSTTGGSWSLMGEFAGLFLVRQSQGRRTIRIARSLLSTNNRAQISDLINHLSSEMPAGSVSIVDFDGGWAELDSEQDLARFRFGTKAETLHRLQGQLESACILPLHTLRVREWYDDPESVLLRIREAFPDTSVVVRSSALNEDTESSSLAGTYESVLDVPTENTEALATALNQVCASYGKDGDNNDPHSDDHQVLVQPMLRDVVISGVALTADLESSAPYYIVNYDTSGSTESITSGIGRDHRTLVVYKYGEATPADPLLAAVIRALQEIEAKTRFTSLDVEFAVRTGSAKNQPEVVIFQVRPIAAHKDQLRVSAAEVGRELAHVKRFLTLDARDGTALVGTRAAWGVMPDWNPAEIIGINPRPLALSLYRTVITDEIWGRSREECGYRRTRPRPGVVDLAGKPYVDIRMSFTSFTPATLEEKIAHRLVDASLSHLALNPELHDKVEFSVMPTAYDLDFDARLAPSARFCNWTRPEVDAIGQAYRDLTLRIIAGQPDVVSREIERLQQLQPRRQRVLAELESDSVSSAAALAMLLDDCREYGTLPFSNLARYAFIGIIQLRSLIARGLLSTERTNLFLASIETVAKEFIRDLASCSRDELLRQYGHLRPGTYDITTPAYHEAFDQYVDLNNRPDPEPLPAFYLTSDEESLIDRELVSAGFVRVDGTSLSARNLLDFVRSAVQGRERGKFEFTRNLSVAVDLIVKIAESEGLTREEASFLKVEEIIVLSGASRPAGLAALWSETVERRRRRHLVTSAIRMPPVITSPSDVECFPIADESPNFVTQKTVQGAPHLVQGIDTRISGHVVLIENADPGFDWIFSHEITALVTKYGGANSHMAIRCAEFEIPAAIGCGEAIFGRLEKAHLVRLECNTRRIEVIR